MQYFSKPVLLESDIIFHLKLLVTPAASFYWKAIQPPMSLSFVQSWMPAAKTVPLIATNTMNHESKGKNTLHKGKN